MTKLFLSCGIIPIIDMNISVFAPQYGVIEAVTPPFRTFNTANEFLATFGKKPIFKVEYVGLNEYVPANNGEYTIKTDRLLKDVTETDLLIIPPTYGDTARGARPTPRRSRISGNCMKKVPASPACASVRSCSRKLGCSTAGNVLPIGPTSLNSGSGTPRWK